VSNAVAGLRLHRLASLYNGCPIEVMGDGHYAFAHEDSLADGV
jgi:hypothetical protein